MHVVKTYWKTVIFIQLIVCYFHAEGFVFELPLVGTSHNYAKSIVKQT